MLRRLWSVCVGDGGGYYGLMRRMMTLIFGLGDQRRSGGMWNVGLEGKEREIVVYWL
jgi:hypothetical protein